MARVWIELFNPKSHADFISTSHVGGILPEQRDNLLPRQVLCVEVCSFTFQFLSEPQLQEAISYFSKKTHPSTREYNDGLEHYWQKWFERLPPGLVSNGKRQKVLAALQKAKLIAVNL